LTHTVDTTFAQEHLDVWMLNRWETVAFCNFSTEYSE